MSTSPSDLTAALEWRYATKAFDPDRKIPQASWDALLKCLVLTPSSFGLQPWKFMVIESTDVREKLRGVSWGQAQVTDADKLVVFTTRTDLTPNDTRRWIERMAEVQGLAVTDLDGYAKVVNGFANNMDQASRQAWNTRQVYIALGQFMTSAAVMGIDTCPLEGLDPASYDEILGLKDSGYATCVACAAGYRSQDDKAIARKKARFPDSDVIVRI